MKITAINGLSPSFPERLPEPLRHLTDNIAVGDQRENSGADPRGRIAEGRQQVVVKMHGQPGRRRATQKLRNSAAHRQKPVAAALHRAPENEDKAQRDVADRAEPYVRLRPFEKLREILVACEKEPHRRRRECNHKHSGHHGINAHRENGSLDALVDSVHIALAVILSRVARHDLAHRVHALREQALDLAAG